MRTFHRGAAALLAVMLCSAAPGAQESDQGQPSSGQPRNEALPPDPPPPATFGSTDRRNPQPGDPPEPNPTDQERLDNLVAQADDPFVPIDQLPPEEQLPAAPMLIAAYIVVVLAIFAYLFSISRRLSAVKQEIARLEVETRRSSRS